MPKLKGPSQAAKSIDVADSPLATMRFFAGQYGETWAAAGTAIQNAATASTSTP